MYLSCNERRGAFEGLAGSEATIPGLKSSFGSKEIERRNLEEEDDPERRGKLLEDCG